MTTIEEKYEDKLTNQKQRNEVDYQNKLTEIRNRHNKEIEVYKKKVNPSVAMISVILIFYGVKK